MADYNAATEHTQILQNPEKFIGKMSIIDRKLNFINKSGIEPISLIIKYCAALEYIFVQSLIFISNHALAIKIKNNDTLPVMGININNKSGTIIMWCAGSCIPIVMNQYNQWTPTMAFSALELYRMTNDKGIVSTNIFSTEFTVETYDQKIGKKFIQKFSNNMRNISEPTIFYANVMDFIQITFVPDYKKFGFDCINSDIITVFEKNICDIARERHLRIYYNTRCIDFSY